jgi:hypothetical protein
MASEELKERLRALALQSIDLHQQIKLQHMEEEDDDTVKRYLFHRGLMTAEEAGVTVQNMTDPEAERSRNDTGTVNTWGMGK